MTVKECYEKMGADYADVMGRLGSEALVKRFALKFLEDKSYTTMLHGVENKDVEEAFRAAHTLKGVCANLGFEKLRKVAAEITEIFRAKTFEGSEELLLQVKEAYELTVEAIGQME